jgi:signal transduction histidine kinase/CHASE3 domain sensor protein
MKIRTKLILGLSLLPILIFLLIGIGWFQLQSFKTMNAKSESKYDLVISAEQVHRKVKNEAISLRNLIIFDDKELINKELTTLQNESDIVDQNIAMLEKKVTSDKQKKLVKKLYDTNQSFNTFKEATMKLISQGNKEDAIQLIISRGETFRTEFSQVITEINNNFEDDMKSSSHEFSTNFERQIWIGSLISILGILIVIMIVFRSVWATAKRLGQVSNVMVSVANGSADLSTKIEVKSNDEIDAVALSFNHMVESLEQQKIKEDNLIWIKSNIAEISTNLSGIHQLESLSKNFLSKVAPLMDVCHAVFFVKDPNEKDNEPVFKLQASYAFKERKHLSNTFSLGEGLIGQAALEKTSIILTDVPPDYVRIKSGLGEAPPLNIYVLPVSFEGEVKAVLEFASFKPFTITQQTFIEELINSLGIILDSVMGRIQLAKLLEETQVLMEEIQAQSEELQSQQEELRVTNEELEEQAQVLRQSEEKLHVQQEELEQTNFELKEKAENLEEQNRKFELTNREVEKAREELEEKARQLALSSKYKSEFLANMSHELRTPLNSLLILSKLLSDNLEGNLSKKQIEYSKTIFSSGRDLLALINDILDLAKIESGKMEVNLSKFFIEDIVDFVEKAFRPIAIEKKINFDIIISEGIPNTIYSDEQRVKQVIKNLLSNAFKFTKHGRVILEIGCSSTLKNESRFSFSIKDTGIGIPKEKQDYIFEAFQQADGTTSRKYGGTGLGLSICREISALLDGKLFVDSEEGKGSTFTFYIGDYQGEEPNYSNSIVVNEVATTIEEQTKPTHSLEANQIQLKENSDIKRLLIVDDDLKQRNSLMELIGDKNVILKAVSSGAEALEELKFSQFDCLILDLGLADTSGFELLEKIKRKEENKNLAIFIYTGRDLSSKEEITLKKYANSIIIKDEHAPKRLKDELELFLAPSKEKVEIIENPMIEQTINHIPGLVGKKVLLVDDDVRNVYAISSILELYGITSVALI